MTDTEEKVDACFDKLNSSKVKNAKHVSGIVKSDTSVMVKMFKNPKASLNPSYPILVTMVMDVLQDLPYQFEPEWKPKTHGNTLKLDFSPRGDR